MEDIKVRRYIDGDETEICEVVKKDVLAENIKDYPKEAIGHLIESHNEDLIRRRAKAFHVYVLTDNEKIIGVGIILLQIYLIMKFLKNKSFCKKDGLSLLFLRSVLSLFSTSLSAPLLFPFYFLLSGYLFIYIISIILLYVICIAYCIGTPSP